MSKDDPMGDRMKRNYEDAFRATLPLRLPVVIRVDGKAFHTYTRSLERPFSQPFIDAMDGVAIYLCQNIQGARLAYVQSDEISVLLNNYRTLNTSAWFDGNIQKCVSVAAGLASAKMTAESAFIFGSPRLASFDARIFVLPPAEVNNYFLWRQNDWSRNSLAMAARAFYSDKELFGKGHSDLHELLHAKGQNWNDLPTYLRRGRCVVRAYDDRSPFWKVDNEIPRFSENTLYIEQHIVAEEE